MKEINHDIFGRITFDYSWEREQEINFFGKKSLITLVINGEEDTDFEQSQINSFINFMANKNKYLAEAEKEIFKYYQEVCPEYRDRLGDTADEFAPIVSSNEEIGNLAELTQIIFPYSFGKETRKVGLLLNCTWEPEHGLAVKFVNEEITKVGYQDIVL
jgi:hypothetical protein